jgi:hypothetical protein
VFFALAGFVEIGLAISVMVGPRLFPKVNMFDCTISAGVMQRQHDYQKVSPVK